MMRSFLFGSRQLVLLLTCLLALLALRQDAEARGDKLSLEGDPLQVQFFGVSSGQYCFRCGDEVLVVDKATKKPTFRKSYAAQYVDRVVGLVVGQRLFVAAHRSNVGKFEWVDAIDIPLPNKVTRLEIKSHGSRRYPDMFQVGEFLCVNSAGVCSLFRLSDLSASGVYPLDTEFKYINVQGVFELRGKELVHLFALGSSEPLNEKIPLDREYHPFYVVAPPERTCVFVVEEVDPSQHPMSPQQCICLDNLGKRLFLREKSGEPFYVNSEGAFFLQYAELVDGVPKFKIMYWSFRESKFAQYEDIAFKLMSPVEFLDDDVFEHNVDGNLVVERMRPRREVLFSFHIDSLKVNPEFLTLHRASLADGIVQQGVYLFGDVEWLLDVPELASKLLKAAPSVLTIIVKEPGPPGKQASIEGDPYSLSAFRS